MQSAKFSSTEERIYLIVRFSCRRHHRSVIFVWLNLIHFKSLQSMWLLLYYIHRKDNLSRGNYFGNKILKIEFKGKEKANWVLKEEIIHLTWYCRGAIQKLLSSFSIRKEVKPFKPDFNVFKIQRRCELNSKLYH